MTTKLLIGKDINGIPTYQIPFTNVGYSVTLTANASQNLTVPANVDTVFFTFGSGYDVWVDPVNTATLPSGTFTATTADLNPVARNVTPGQTLSFISAEAADVKVSFYKLNGLN